MEASFGTSMFGGSEESDDRSRADAGSDFTKIRAQLSHTHQVWDAFSVYGYAAGQIADDALLSSEEFTVGGLPVGRGYDYSEISGDHGVAALIELRYGRDTELALLDAYQLYGFYDFGATWNDGSFEDPRDTLASSGLGVRFVIPKGVRLEFEMSKTLTRPVNADGDRPWLGFVTFSASF